MRSAAAPLLWAGMALALAGCARDSGTDREAVGTLERRSIRISPTTGGRIRDLRVDEGDSVSVGDTLAVLEIPTLPAEVDRLAARVAAARAALAEALAGPRSAELERAEAEVRGAEAEVHRTAAEEARLVELAVQELASPQASDAARAAAQGARASRDAAEAALRLLREGTRPERIAAVRAEADAAEAALAAARATGEDLILRAPVAGRVLIRSAEPGEVVSPGESLLTLGETDRLRVRFFVGQGVLPRLEVGGRVEAVLDDFPDHPVEGRIVSLATEAEFTPRVALTEGERADLVYAVRAEFRDSAGILKAGLPVTIRIP